MAERETAAATGRAHLYDTGGAGVKMKEESATSAEECVGYRRRNDGPYLLLQRTKAECVQ